MRNREEVAWVRAHLGMFFPRSSFRSVVGFFMGAQWADPEFIPHIRAFTAMRYEGENLAWPYAAVRHALGEALLRALVDGEGSESEELEAVDALFDAVDDYFACVEAGEIRQVREAYEARFSR